MDPEATWAVLKDACPGIAAGAPALAGPLRDTVREFARSAGAAAVDALGSLALTDYAGFGKLLLRFTE